MDNNSKKRNISTIIILAIVLLVPGFLYIVLNKVGSNEYLRLPIFGEKVLTGKMVRKMGREMPDTLYHQVKPLEFVDSDSNKVTLFEQDSVITVVHLFYPNDKGLSNTLLQNLIPIAERFINNPKVKFYSINVNSNSSVEEMQTVAKKFTKKYPHSWKIVGGQPSVLDYAQQNLLIDAMLDPQNDSSFIISNNYVLIDSERRIRGFYDINLKTEIDRLEDEIKVQLVEEARNNPFKIEKK